MADVTDARADRRGSIRLTRYRSAGPDPSLELGGNALTRSPLNNIGFGLFDDDEQFAGSPLNQAAALRLLVPRSTVATSLFHEFFSRASWG
ncbi:MAG TPA: hypothetical protein VIF40_09730 [Methylosinus sp.]|uniref:hypothetical protein n=1 Tax=Methylosinus sp. TaxID=427 RepID=UPI002F940690